MPTKRDRASSVIADRHRFPGSQAEPSAEEATHSLDNASRRNFLRSTGTLAGSALATSIPLALADPLAIPESNKGFGKPIPEDDYGVPSKYEAYVRRRRTDVLK